MRALITGLGGQDASFLSELLLEKGYKVFGTMRPIDSDENIRHIKNRLHILNGDITSDTDMNAILKEADPDEVYSLAAISHVGFSFEQPVLTANTTGLGPLRLLNAIKNYNPKIKFYQASTSELFGNVKTYPQNENTPMAPCSPYAIAKHFAYESVQMYRQAYKMFAVNGILYNHESERRGINFVTRKITYTIAKIKAGLEKELVLGNTQAKKDWGYAPDFCRAMWLMMQHNKPDDFVIGTGELHTVQEFVEEAFKVAKLNWKDYVKTDKQFFRPIDTLPFQADYSKAKKELGWEPKVKFKELVKIMVKNDIGGIKNV